MEDCRPIQRALISVSDKTHLIPFAQALVQQGIALLSTGGTAKLLTEHNIPVQDVSDHTGFPEMMAGRVKTLHPLIHGGILGRRHKDSDIMESHGIAPIDLVVVNLYPFVETTQRLDATFDDIIENIDIGGPAMIRSAAKNHRDVAVVVNPIDYDNLLSELNAQNGQLKAKTRFELAVKAFEHTAQYDGHIANHLGKYTSETQEKNECPFPQTLNQQWQKKQILRYGENAHQKAAFYTESAPQEASVSTAYQHQGKALSYNNLADTDAALECVKEFDAPACVIVKHANPCGVSVATTSLDAYQLAYQTDPTSAFGGIIAFNRPLNAKTATAILSQQFVEVIIAPTIDSEALIVCQQKPNIRVLSSGKWTTKTTEWDTKRLNGGLLVQERDQGNVTASDLTVVTKRHPTEQERQDALFCWKVAKYVKSNAIVYAKNNQTVGIGAGQMSRVYSAKVAILKAEDEGLKVKGSVMASDAFFPFRDGIDAAAQAGVTCVIQPGGSMRDNEVIEAANQHDIAMIFTGMRHFRH